MYPVSYKTENNPDSVQYQHYVACVLCCTSSGLIWLSLTFHCYRMKLSLFRHRESLFNNGGNRVSWYWHFVFLRLVILYCLSFLTYAIILCCPCYMAKYVPRLEGIMHDPNNNIVLSMDNTILLLLLLWMSLVILKNENCLKCIDSIKIGK